jgi:hypothetical protein
MGFDGDALSFFKARDGPERWKWMNACDGEYENLQSHDAYEEVPEDSLKTWNSAKGRSSEVVDTLWVLKRKRDEDNNISKYKGRIVFDGRQQKTKALDQGRVIDTFAPTCRHSTFRTLCAQSRINKSRVRRFDVEGAYLKGAFEDEEIVYARPPPGFAAGSQYRRYDERAVPIVWKLKVPLYGEADAGRIWNRTMVKQLVDKQLFTQSNFDPCYFYKVLADGTRMDLCVYVDDGFYADEHSPLADAELDAFEAAGFTLTRSDVPRHFLGCNVDVHDESKLSLTMRAYVAQLASKYLPKALAEYKEYRVPATKKLMVTDGGLRDGADARDGALSRPAQTLWIKVRCRDLRGADCAI